MKNKIKNVGYLSSFGSGVLASSIHIKLQACVWISFHNISSHTCLLLLLFCLLYLFCCVAVVGVFVLFCFCVFFGGGVFIYLSYCFSIRTPIVGSFFVLGMP